MVRCAEKSPPSHGTDCGRGGVSVHCRPITAAAGENRAPPRIAAKRPTLYPPPPNPLRSVITLYPLRSPATAPACCARTHSTTRTVPAAHLPALTALCNECTLQSLQTAITLHPYTHPARAYRSHLIPPPPFRLLPTRALAAPSSPYPPGKPRNHPHPARSLVEVIALCNECTMQSLHSAITHPAPPAPRQLSNFPTSRKADKLASWQTPPPSPAPPTRAGCPSFLSSPAGKPTPPTPAPCARPRRSCCSTCERTTSSRTPPPHLSRLNVPPTAPCIPAALAPTAPPEPCR